MLIAVASATLEDAGDKSADAVKSDSSPVESLVNYRTEKRIRRQATSFTPNVPVINGAAIPSTSLIRVEVILIPLNKTRI